MSYQGVDPAELAAERENEYAVRARLMEQMESVGVTDEARAFAKYVSWGLPEAHARGLAWLFFGDLARMPVNVTESLRVFDLVREKARAERERLNREIESLANIYDEPKGTPRRNLVVSYPDIGVPVIPPGDSAYAETHAMDTVAPVYLCMACHITELDDSDEGWAMCRECRIERAEEAAKDANASQGAA